MRELLTRGKSEPAAAPITLILGTHADSGVKGLSHLDNEIGKSLSDTSGNVAVLFEDTSVSARSARRIEESVARGALPSWSLSMHHTLSSCDNVVNQHLVSDFIDFQDAFMREQIRIIDRHSQQSRRIRLIYESSSNLNAFLRATGIIEPKLKTYKEAIASVDRLITVGRFDEALSIFKNAVTSFGRYNQDREDRIIQKISVNAKKPGISSVIGHFGAVHTRMAHMLVRDGHQVRRIFPQISDGRHTYSIINQVLRQKIFFPNKKITELSWLKLMIGSGIGLYLLEEAHIENKGSLEKINEGKIVDKAMKFLNWKFQDLESIYNFESEVRDKGIRRILKENGLL